MKLTPLIYLAMGATVLCDPGSECRCAERDLAEYFADAEEVAVGRLINATPATDVSGAPGSDGEPVVELRFELMSPLYKTSRAEPLRQGETVTYRTSTSTAACGVPSEVDGVYVLFADQSDVSRDGNAAQWRVDTCSGTRVHLAPGLAEPVGFQDVPPRFVMRQLAGLGGMGVIGAVVQNAPDETSVTNERLVGLLDVSSFSHAGFARLHQQPNLTSEVVGDVESYEELESREVGYEEPAAEVFARGDGWYRLRLLDGSFGWLPPDQAGTYFPYPDVAVNRLNYIPAPWHGYLWPSPGAGLPARAPDDPSQREVPIEVIERMDVGGFPWLRINVLRSSPCEAADPATVVSGWIPAWGPDGEPSVWYYSRGC